MHSRHVLTALGLGAALTLSACQASEADLVTGPAPVEVAPSTAAPSPSRSFADPVGVPLPASQSPSSVPSEVAPSVAASPAVPAAPAAPRPDMVAAQQTLTDLGYYVGPLDGELGGSTRSAVMAFQKVQGIGVDGAVGPATLAALAAPVRPTPRSTAGGKRVEVDLDKQVLYILTGGQITRILPVSSGNGAKYAQKNGAIATALTPTGHFTIQRRIVGERVADLGTLYDPQYFYRGWAIHGSNSVPAREASHGCIRVTRTDAKWLLNEISNGVQVHLYGGRFTFGSGSAAPGTDNPTGDSAAPAPVATTSAPAPAPAPQPSAAPAPRPSTSPTPRPTTSPTPRPTTSPTPRPSATPSTTPSATPSTSPSASASPSGG